MVLQCEVRVLEAAATAAAIWEESPFCSFGSHVFEWCWVAESGSWIGLLILLILWNNGKVRHVTETPTFFGKERKQG